MSHEAIDSVLLCVPDLGEACRPYERLGLRLSPPRNGRRSFHVGDAPGLDPGDEDGSADLQGVGQQEEHFEGRGFVVVLELRDVGAIYPGPEGQLLLGQVRGQARAARLNLSLAPRPSGLLPNGTNRECYLNASCLPACWLSSMNLEEQAFLQTLGGRIRQRREALSLTQQQLGDRCGLHRTFIGSVERGERNVSILNLRTIAGALRVPLSELLADSSAGQS